MQKITSCLWFDNQAEEAAKFYTGIFKNSSIGKISRYGKEGQEHHGQEEGAVMTVEFTLDGTKFTGLNGGPMFQFSEAISFQISCKDQKEVDHFWNHLTQGGQEQPCGWVKDQFGVSWQVIPDVFIKLVSDPNREKASRVMAAVFEMKKIDIAKLEEAYRG